MPTYYINERAQANGDHEVHTSTCIYFPLISNKKYLGVFDNCFDAVRESKKTYIKSNGCKTCCPACHTE